MYKPLKEIYSSHEQQKKAEYEDRVRQSEKGSFVPLVFTTLGGMAPECNKLNKKLAEKIAEKRKESYPNVINHILLDCGFLSSGVYLSRSLAKEGNQSINPMQEMTISTMYHST